MAADLLPAAGVSYKRQHQYTSPHRRIPRREHACSALYIVVAANVRRKLNPSGRGCIINLHRIVLRIDISLAAKLTTISLIHYHRRHGLSSSSIRHRQWPQHRCASSQSPSSSSSYPAAILFPAPPRLAISLQASLPTICQQSIGICPFRLSHNNA